LRESGLEKLSENREAVTTIGGKDGPRLIVPFGEARRERKKNLRPSKTAGALHSRMSGKDSGDGKMKLKKNVLLFLDERSSVIMKGDSRGWGEREKS